MIATVERTRRASRPSCSAASVARSTSSAFGLIGGDIFHGELSLDQLFSARPMLGHADYRGPLPASTIAAPAPIPAAASPARPATTPRG